MFYARVINPCRFLKQALAVGGLSLVAVTPLLAQSQAQRYLTNQATVTYEIKGKVFNSRSNTVIARIDTEAETQRKLASRQLIEQLSKSHFRPL